MLRLLNSSITAEYINGKQNLPRGDWHYFKPNLLSLLRRSLQYKKSWLVNLHAARYNTATSAGEVRPETPLSLQHAKVLKWISTNRAE